MLKKFIVLGMIFIINVLIQQASYAGNIQYGYNPDGSYAPQAVVVRGYNMAIIQMALTPHKLFGGGQRIQYGYNPNGSYAPQYIGY